MIHQIFIYNSNSGLLLWQETLDDINKGKTDLFSSFFVAMKSFIQELIVKGDRNLKSIELGNKLIKVHEIPKVEADVVLIADLDDEKKLNKVSNAIAKTIMENADLFKEWDGSSTYFNFLKKPVLRIIKNAKLIDTTSSSLASDELLLLKSIWSKTEELEPELKEALIKQRTLLKNKFNETKLLTKKYEHIKKVLEIDHKLKNEEFFIEDEKIENKIKAQIDDIKVKLDYYLKNTKSSLSKIIDASGYKNIMELNYREPYVALYSFSTKLKAMGLEKQASKFKEMANVLIEKEKYQDDVVNETIRQILKLNDNIDEYLNENAEEQI
ncbi:MAG: hypothetical protein ACTSU2_14510 [Promethearchaeota archaeon]